FILMKNIFQRLLVPNSAKESDKLSSWVLELADMDDISALRFSTQKLAHMIDDAALSTTQKLDLIIEVEDLNHDRLEKLATQFVHITYMKPDLEMSISETCYNYCRQSYICHLRIIELVIDPSKFKLEGTMPILVLARAVYAAFGMSKWRMFVQQNPPTKMWLQIYMLYKVAQKQNLLGMPIVVFPSEQSTTLAALIVQICMLGQLLQMSMQKNHVEIAAKVLAAWLTRAHISNKYTPEQYLFFVDLERDIPAKRMRNFEPNDDCRYWELNDFEKMLTVAITVTERGEMPESLVSSKIENVKRLNETLTTMHAEWKKENYVRQRRKEPREATSKSARVNAGIVNICNHVLQANQINHGMQMSKSGKSLDELLLGHTVLKQTTNLSVTSGSLDTWVITDESAHGYGTRVNKYANILARPDKLISMVIEDDLGKVMIGMIRCVKATQGNYLKVGIEVVSRNAIWVQLKPTQENTAFVDTMLEVNAAHRGSPMDIGVFSAIYLPAEAGLSETPSIILPKINHRPNSKHIIQSEGKKELIVIGAPLESLDDWVKVATTF
ncbi:MAG: hypothetical protein ACT4OH_05180, partial [Methylophilaceae bacterium]